MCVRRWLVVMVVMLASVGHSPTAAPGPTRAAADRTRDILHTMQARKMLMEEPDLLGLNIGVTVRDRVATLWGPVPSAESAFRAELCLRAMIELADVRSELFVNDQLEDIPRGLKKRPPLPPLLPDRLPPKLPPREPTDRKAIFPMPELRPPPDLSEITPKAAAAIQVLRSEAPAVPMLGAPEPDKLTQADRELTGAVRTILQGKAAYRDVQFAVKEGRVYLKASAANTDALHEVARAVARMPNVEGVILLEKLPMR